MKTTHIILTTCIAAFGAASAAQPAFPGAEGAGAGATGGRGGEVFIVTNTNKDGPGSLADAVSRPNRFIVFAISGIIDLTTEKKGTPKGGKLKITQPNLTIAGQTAPGEGICLKGGSLTVDASNVVVRHLRVRRGFVADGDAGDSVEINVKDPAFVKEKSKGTDKDNAKEKLAAGEKLKPATDVIFDHVSSSWGTDENFTMSGHIDRVHAQYCFAAEGLDYDNPGQTPRNHAYGSLMGGSGTDSRVGMAHSIFAHHRRRTPQCSTGDGAGDPPVVIDFRNNIVYDSIVAMSHTGGGAVRLNFVGNYYKTGPSSEAKLAGKWFSMLKGNDKSNLYAAGNFVFGSAEATADNWKGVLFEGKVEFKPSMVVAREYDVPKITTLNAEAAFEDDLQNAGATLPSRDAVDTRVAGHIRTGGGKVIGKETDLPEADRWPDYRNLPALADADHDGLPDFWEQQFGLDQNDARDAMKIAANGYANIEHYVNNTDPRGGSAPVVCVSGQVSRATAEHAGEFRVTRSGGTDAALIVNYTVSGEAEEGKDFAALPGSVTIAAGKTFEIVAITPLAGARDNRTVILAPSGVHAGCPSRALVVIRK